MWKFLPLRRHLQPILEGAVRLRPAFLRALWKFHAFFDRLFLFCNAQECGVELHERVLDRRVLVMALPAIVLSWSHSCAGLLRCVKSEISTLVRKARGVLHFHIQ